MEDIKHISKLSNSINNYNKLLAHLIQLDNIKAYKLSKLELFIQDLNNTPFYKLFFIKYKINKFFKSYFNNNAKVNESYKTAFNYINKLNSADEKPN